MEASGQKIETLMVGDRTIPPEDARYITIQIMGQAYQIPETLTILKAMEYAGYQFKRGCFLVTCQPDWGFGLYRSARRG